MQIGLRTAPQGANIGKVSLGLPFRVKIDLNKTFGSWTKQGLAGVASTCEELLRLNG
jgi:hypothetical protein